MNDDDRPSLTTPSTAAGAVRPASGCRSSSRSIAAPPPIGRLVDALSDLRPAGGLEIVLVNDGSPDNSGDVCRELLAHRAACR